MSNSQVQGLILFIFGVVCIAFAERFGKRAGEFQRRAFRVELAPRFLHLGYLLGGLLFCVIGGLALLGWLQFGS